MNSEILAYIVNACKATTYTSIIWINIIEECVYILKENKVYYEGAIECQVCVKSLGTTKIAYNHIH